MPMLGQAFRRNADPWVRAPHEEDGMTKTPRPPGPPPSRTDGTATPPPGRPARGKANPSLTPQTRKLLGKHYANKYRTKRG